MNTLLDWPTIVSRTLLHEGGYSLDPKDAGGETRFGISKRSYPTVDIKNLTQAQAIEIYAKDFWPGFDQLQAPLAFAAFDFAVNAGRYRSIQFLQFVAGTTMDGVLGPKTYAAIAAIPIAAMTFGFIARVQQFYLENPQWGTYGKGWIDRWTDNLQYASQDFR